MAYQVNNFRGTLVTTVEDGTIDTTTDLRFIGKNYAGYGEVQNENFLHLLENFSSNSAPPKKVTGQIWYDSGNKKLKFYDGTRFKVASGAESSSTAPSGLSVGEFWWDTAAQQLYTWSGTDFVLVGPEASPELGASTVSAQVVKDTLNNNHTIIKFTAGGRVVAIASQDEFTLNAAINDIADFSFISKGLTLVDSSTGISSNSYRFWGTASDTDRLGGVLADRFIQKGAITFDQEIKFSDSGYQVGDGNDIRMYVAGGDQAILENRIGNNLTIRINVSETPVLRDYKFTSTGLLPGTTDLFTIGTIAERFSSIYATSLVGNLLAGDLTSAYNGSTKVFTGAAFVGSVQATDNTTLINGTTKQIGYSGANLVGVLTGSCTGSAASATNAQNLQNNAPSETVPGTAVATIPIRNAAGNIYANQFIGIADHADRIRINNSATDVAWNGSVASTQYRTAMTSQTAWTIAARDGSANITANIFNGTATAARYADLAEKYLADQDYDTGTVVTVGGEAEVRATVFGDRAIGVVSTNPAFMMNKDLEGGTYIALKGRVPVKVIGAIKKGDRLVATDNGHAIHASFHQHPDVFAMALESSNDTGVKLIESVIL